MTQLVTYGSVGGVGRKPGPYPAANGRQALRFMSHWFYNIIGFGWCALSAPVAELIS